MWYWVLSLEVNNIISCQWFVSCFCWLFFFSLFNIICARGRRFSSKSYNTYLYISEWVIILCPFFLLQSAIYDLSNYGLIFPNMFIAYRFTYSVSFFVISHFIGWFVNLLTGRQKLLPRLLWLLFLLQPLSTQPSLHRFGILVYWFRANSIVIMLFDTFQLWRSILIISCCHSRFLSYLKRRQSTK